MYYLEKVDIMSHPSTRAGVWAKPYVFNASTLYTSLQSFQAPHESSFSDNNDKIKKAA
jgi:hypothetical protein